MIKLVPTAFTTVYKNGKPKSLNTEITIFPSQPESNVVIDNISSIDVIGLWDTGAMGCTITQKVIEKLKLLPIGKKMMIHAGGQNIVNEYLIDIILPNKIRFLTVPVLECKSIGGEFDMIVGMDLINYGDFALTHPNNDTFFSFSIPANRKIDFVKEINEMNNRIYKKTKRNDPCPCGSGLKFKYCHGKNQKLNNEFY